jgi:hypothetical protein
VVLLLCAGLAFYVKPRLRVARRRAVDFRISYPALSEIILQVIGDAEIPALPADVIPFLPRLDRGRYF